MNANLEDKLQTVFSEHFQVKRVMKQIENLREAKQKLGLENRYSLTRGVHISIIIEISKLKLKELKPIAFLDKLQFKIVLKATYPNDPPRVYFFIQNPIEFGINPFYDYFKSIAGDWSPRITIIDIVKNVPIFLARCLQNASNATGNPLLNQFFQVQRLFAYQNCQTFPVKLVRGSQYHVGMLAIVSQTQLVVLEQTNFQNSYYTADFIPIGEIHSVAKHRTKLTCCMLEVKRNGKKFGLEFHSDQYDTIISAVSDAVRATLLMDKPVEDSSSSDEQSPGLLKKDNNELVVTESNINQIESQMMILQSIVANSPNSKNVKETVDMLKKLVEYYSVKGDKRCQLHLKNLQEFMANEMMQVLLASDEEENYQKHQKTEYQSIANII